MKLRPPANLREVFQMLGFYDSGRGLDSVVERFDFGSTPPWHLQQIIFGGVTPSEMPAIDPDPSGYVKQLLSSDGFRRDVLQNFLNGFHEQRRLLFVHIQKCAGTDLIAALSERYFDIDANMDDPFWFSSDRRFAYLRDLVLAAPFVNALFVHGHVPLHEYVNRKLIRPGDQIFTVVRDPVDIVISAVNYRLARFQADPRGERIDTRLWLADLGIKPLSGDAGTSELQGLAKRILRTPTVVPDNILCQMLGTGDSQSALAYIVASDIEITDLTRYGTWLRERWGAESQHYNASHPFWTAATLDPEDRAVIETKTIEDRVLYATLMKHLDATGQSFISGEALGG
jgi:hypothetical protein